MLDNNLLAAKGVYSHKVIDNLIADLGHPTKGEQAQFIAANLLRDLTASMETRQVVEKMLGGESEVCGPSIVLPGLDVADALHQLQDDDED